MCVNPLTAAKWCFNSGPWRRVFLLFSVIIDKMFDSFVLFILKLVFLKYEQLLGLLKKGTNVILRFFYLKHFYLPLHVVLYFVVC